MHIEAVDRAGRTHLIAGALIAALLAMVATSCSGGSDSQQASTAFEAALSTVGGGGDPVGTGYGWVDVAELRSRPGGLRSSLTWAANALGPDAGRIAVDRRKSVGAGIDPDQAEDLVSISASFAFGLRLDGVDAGLFSSALRGERGVRARREGAWTSYDVGAERATPIDTSFAALGPLASRVAVSDRSVILARIDSARGWLMGAGDPATTADSVSVAAACLGDVVAARIVPNNFTYAPNFGPDLLAFGVRLPPAGPAHEVFCTIDPSAEEIDAAARGMRAAFARGSRDAVTGKPFSDTFSAAAITTGEQRGLHLARADLTELQRARPGFLFTAFFTGSLLTYEGLSPPRPNP